MSNSQTHPNQNARFRRSAKVKENLRASAKLWQMALNGKKEKWGFLKAGFRRQTFSLLLAAKRRREMELLRLEKEFAQKWQEKQSLKDHYLIPNEKHWQRLALKALKQREAETAADASSRFLILWESRLDVCLWKAGLLPSIASARQWILHGFVYVNQTPSPQASQLLSPGDFVEIRFSAKNEALWRERYRNESFFRYPPKTQQRRSLPLLRPPAHLEVHYTSFSFVFVEKPNPKSLRYPYRIYPQLLPLQRI